VSEVLPDWSREIAPGSWGMLANDTTGDCTIAAVGHAVALWRSYDPPMTFMTDAEALAAFAVVSPSRQGAYLKDVLARWEAEGFTVGGKLDKLGGYTTLPLKDHKAITDAIEQDGCVMCGVLLREAQDPGDEHPWQTTSGPVVGGHCVLLVKVTDQGPVCVTWGRLVQITWDWWDACADEASGLKSKDWKRP
jgi:hypothetical protein